jgi:APA family basic amino acid/polyamine antiporter
MPALHRTLDRLEFFTFGVGSMVGVGWLVLMDDWLGRGGPGGVILGFLAGGLLLLPVARTYGRLVQAIPDAGAEVAYAERAFPPFAGFAAGWIMVLAYAIVCPWEAVAIGNLLARVFPGMNRLALYSVASNVMYAPRLVAGLALTALVAVVNLRGIRLSGRFQNLTTFGLLCCFGVFAALGLARGSPARMPPLFARPGAAGALVSVLLVAQIVPYFMTGFESVAKASEEAREGFDPRNFSRVITLAVVAGAFFYALVVGAVSFVYPWRDLVDQHLGTETAFARAFGSQTIARLILFGAFLSLFKVLNGNFVAATRLLFALGRRRLVHPALASLHPERGTPTVAVLLMTLLTAAGAFLGDAVLVPISEVGSLASGVGWCTACLAFLRFDPARGRAVAAAGAAASVVIIVMKVVPAVPGSFARVEWLVLATWMVLGLVFWLVRRRG